MIGVRSARKVRTARPVTLPAATALVAALALGAECSDSGAGAGDEGAGTPRMTIGMVTHSGEGDTFWDIVQNGAERAAAKDRVKFLYANDEEGAKQAELVQ